MPKTRDDATTTGRGFPGTFHCEIAVDRRNDDDEKNGSTPPCTRGRFGGHVRRRCTLLKVFAGSAGHSYHHTHTYRYHVRASTNAQRRRPRAWVRRQIFGVFLGGRRRATGRGRFAEGSEGDGDGMTGVLAYADIYWVERIKGLVRDAGGVGHPILLRILITASPPPPRWSDAPARRRRRRDVHVGIKSKTVFLAPPPSRHYFTRARTYTGREHLTLFPVQNAMHNICICYFFSPSGNRCIRKYLSVRNACTRIFQTRLDPP